MTGPQRLIPSNLPFLKHHPTKPAAEAMPVELPNNGEEAPTSSSSGGTSGTHHDDNNNNPNKVNKGSKDKKSNKKAKKAAKLSKSQAQNTEASSSASGESSSGEWSTAGMTPAEVEKLLHDFLLSLPQATHRGLADQ